MQCISGVRNPPVEQGGCDGRPTVFEAAPRRYAAGDDDTTVVTWRYELKPVVERVCAHAVWRYNAC